MHEDTQKNFLSNQTETYVSPVMNHKHEMRLLTKDY
jgi:hypothetical protein